MSHMALRRDLEDPNLVKELGEAVGFPEMLKMLYVLTACDLRAVSEESWNDWRGRLLAELFERTLNHLRGIQREHSARRPRHDQREQVWQELNNLDRGGEHNRASLDHYLSDMPERYLASVLPGDIAKHCMLKARVTSENRIKHRIDTYEGSNYVEITFASTDAPGLFSHLCGALSSKGFNILSAQIYTATSGEAIDIFQVQVPEGRQDTLDSDLERMCHRIVQAMDKGEKPNYPKGTAGARAALLTPDRLELRPPRIDISNEKSPTHTVIEIRSPDQPGLLSAITELFDRYSVNIDLAFIATESYQVVDVFYVTDLEANKLEEGGKLESIRGELMELIHEKIGDVK